MKRVIVGAMLLFAALIAGAAGPVVVSVGITNVTGLGTGIATALGINVGTAGAPVTNGGALGTPSSGTLTNATGLPTTGLTGALQAAQEPAHTGDVTNSAGSLATTLAAGSASNLNSGTLAAARGGAGTINGALKGNGSGVVLQAACADLSNAGAGCTAAVTTVGTAAVGQIPGTTTNDNASAGNVGEVIGNFGVGVATNTVTISNASPAVISDTAACTALQASNCIGIGSAIYFTTSGGLPTGLAINTAYYVIATGFTASTSYQISATPFGTAINTSSAGSGTHTRNSGIVNNGGFLATGTFGTSAAVSLTAGDWTCSATSSINTTGVTTVVRSFFGTTNNSSTGRIPESDAYETVSITGDLVIRGNGPIRLLLSGTTTYYLLVSATYSTSGVSGTGSILCRRTR